VDRRTVLKGVAVVAAAVVVRPSMVSAAITHGTRKRLEALEREHGGRLGVAILDTGSGQRAGYREHERFLMCSTFKLLLVGAVLSRSDNGVERLDRRLVFGRDAVLEYAPVTSRHVGPPGMTIAELCRAAITVSDNTAANVLLEHLGGPGAVTAHARQLGDSITRLDRIEPELNSASVDGLSDTTVPAAMLEDLRKLCLGDALSATSRQQLVGWLCKTTTGATLLRAGVPAGWRVGDKTGSSRVQRNDVAIVWPPKRRPLLVAAYYENAAASGDDRAAVLARVGRLLG
jgi:beta-lactamase class A